MKPYFLVVRLSKFDFCKKYRRPAPLAQSEESVSTPLGWPSRNDESPAGPPRPPRLSRPSPTEPDTTQPDTEADVEVVVVENGSPDTRF
jgi:hypothetical protein